MKWELCSAPTVLLYLPQQMVLLVFLPTTLCLGGVFWTHISRVAHWPFEGHCTDRPSYHAAAKKKLFLPDGFLDDLKDHPNGSKDRSSEKRGSVFGIPSFHQLRRMSDTSMRQVKERLRRMSTTGRDLARNRFWNLFRFVHFIRIWATSATCLIWFFYLDSSPW